jgi:drug/metabolite transporter (DMT)-like permease
MLDGTRTLRPALPWARAARWPDASGLGVGITFALASGLLIASLGTLSHLSYDAGLTPLSFAAWRGLVAALFLALVVLLRRAAGGPGLAYQAAPREQRLALAGATAANLALTLALFTAYARIPVAVAVLVFYSYPAFVALVGAATGRERMTVSRAVAIGIALVGMALVVAARLDVGSGLSLDLVGIGCALGAAAGKTTYLWVSRAGYDRVPPDQAVLVILGGCGIGAAAAAIVTGGGASLAGPLAAPAAWPSILLAATVAGAIPMAFLIAGVRRLGGTRTAIAMLSEPTVSVGIAAIVLGEGIVPLQVVGAVLVLAGGIAVQRQASARP